VSGSHSRTVPSSPAEASSGRPPTPVPNATDNTGPQWPVSGCPTCSPVSGSHSRTVSSEPAEASSGRPPAPVPNATEDTPPVWPVRPESVGRAGRWQSPYHDTMLDHDDLVGDLLDLLDELGIAENTIVMYSTDNGPHMNSWPDAGMTPYRNEKNSNWEGAYRVPAMLRWPAGIPAGTVLNGIVSHNDWFVTLMSAVGVADIADKLRAGTDLGGRTYKVHLDGHDQLPYITGQTDESPREHFFYVSDDGDLTALRFDNWKLVFKEQRCPGTLQIWAEPFTDLRVPKFFNLRTDPYERADITSNTYYDWLLDHAFMAIPAQAYVAQMLQTFAEFPPRQKSASFNLDQVIAKLQETAKSD
jgi:arylsulfatase A-like enzyme